MKKFVLFFSLVFMVFSVFPIEKQQILKVDSVGNLVVGSSLIKLTSEQLYKVDSVLAKKLGINDSIAKVKADSLAVIGKIEQQKVIDDPNASKSEKAIATIMAALLTLLGFIYKIFKNKVFDNEILKRFFGETPKFWRRVSWLSVIILFLSLSLIGIDQVFVTFLSTTLLSILYYMITICFTIFVTARFTLKQK